MSSKGQPAPRRAGRNRISLRRATAAAALLCGVIAPVARAQTGGTVPSLAPKVSGFECRSACTALDAVRSGGTVRVEGSNLSNAAAVVFEGAKGSADDVMAQPRDVTDSRLDVTVPDNAVGGPLAVVNVAGQSSKPSSASLGIFRGKAVRDVKSLDGTVDAQIVSKRVFFAGRHKAALRYLVLNSAKKVRIDLVSRKTNEVVQRWSPGTVPANEPRTVSWSGLTGGHLAGQGGYQFRLYTGTSAVIEPGQASTAQADPEAAGSFTFLRNEFPVRGAHSFGDAVNRFGAARSGHVHQGQDVLAACGTPLVAARGGVVQHKAFHSAAGNYVVIDGADTGVDEMYAHLRVPALVNEGDHVYTGEPIGFVGETGDAVGCHLHFEMWGAPGWYEGGSPFDPLAYLKAWDRDT
jgi:murein DD-endopeptidase MepM/ murein hydrolase activator NlpD